MILSNHHKTIDEDIISEKEVIKVFVITGPKTSGIVTYENDVNGIKSYSGLVWDILEALKKLPDFDKYQFEYTFSEPGYNNYDETVDWVSSGKYDLGLAIYMQNTNRESKINYTVPINIDAFAVYHYTDTNMFQLFKDTLHNIGYFIMVLIILGILFGIMLFLVDPNRNRAKGHNKRIKAFFLRSILTGVATFFGEAGFLFENSTPTIKGLIAVSITMLVAIIFLQFMQAQITSSLIEKKMDKGLSITDIKLKPVLGHDGYAHTTRWEENGGKVVRHKGKNNSDLLEIYKKDPNKYLGVVLSYYDGYPFIDLNPGIVASVFGDTPTCMIYNPNKLIFGEELNKGLLHIRATKTLNRICNSYFGINSDPNAHAVCAL